MAKDSNYQKMLKEIGIINESMNVQLGKVYTDKDQPPFKTPQQIKEEELNELNFDEDEYIKRIAAHYQTGIILQKMAQQMDKENRTDTEHKVLHMSLGKYLKMLKRVFKL